MKQNKNRGVGAARGGVYFFKGGEEELRAATDVWHIKNRKRKKNDFLCLVVFRFVRSFGRKKTSSLRFKWHTCRSFVVLPTVPKRRALRAPFWGGVQ